MLLGILVMPLVFFLDNNPDIGALLISLALILGSSVVLCAYSRTNFCSGFASVY